MWCIWLPVGQPNFLEASSFNVPAMDYLFRICGFVCVVVQVVILGARSLLVDWHPIVCLTLKGVRAISSSARGVTVDLNLSAVGIVLRADDYSARCFCLSLAVGTVVFDDIGCGFSQIN